MITGPEKIATAFSLFHDGVISSHLSGQDELMLVVEIRYLAQRINPTHTKFLVCLFGAEDIEFHTWPNDGSNFSQTLTIAEDIFKPRLDILQADVRGKIVEVVCNQASPAFPYCGGELQFKVDTATVSDEDGRLFSLDELERLSKDYWDDWSKAGN